jgi:hypothetical protein
LGKELIGLAGNANLQANARDVITLPSNGPSFGMWQLVKEIS